MTRVSYTNELQIHNKYYWVNESTEAPWGNLRPALKPDKPALVTQYTRQKIETYKTYQK